MWSLTLHSLHWEWKVKSSAVHYGLQYSMQLYPWQMQTFLWVFHACTFAYCILLSFQTVCGAWARSSVYRGSAAHTRSFFCLCKTSGRKGKRGMWKRGQTKRKRRFRESERGKAVREGGREKERAGICRSEFLQSASSELPEDSHLTWKRTQLALSSPSDAPHTGCIFSSSVSERR